MSSDKKINRFIEKYLSRVIGSCFLMMITFFLIFILWMFNLFERGIVYYDVVFFIGGFLIDFIIIYFICKRKFKDTFIVYGISFLLILIYILFLFYKYIGF